MFSGPKLTDEPNCAKRDDGTSFTMRLGVMWPVVSQLRGSAGSDDVSTFQFASTATHRDADGQARP
jgi:hypothetical protein